jgi:hypothetical protein
MERLAPAARRLSVSWGRTFRHRIMMKHSLALALLFEDVHTQDALSAVPLLPIRFPTLAFVYTGWMPVDQLRLRIRGDADPDGTWFREGWCELVAEASSNGFSGTSNAWFRLSELGRFAEGLGEYPMFTGSAPVLKGGYFTSVGSKRADFYVLVAVGPYDRRALSWCRSI